VEWIKPAQEKESIGLIENLRKTLTIRQPIIWEREYSLLPKRREYQIRKPWNILSAK